MAGLTDLIPQILNRNKVATDISSYAANPYLSPLKDQISKMTQTGFTPITSPNNAYMAKDMSSATLPQYDAMRNRINSQYSQTQQQGQDAIDRQFAAMGGGPGNGAQLKQTENLSGEIAKQKGNDLNNINAEEAQTRTALQQEENQKEFQSQEAQKGRNLQTSEFNTQMGNQYSQNLLNANSLLSQLESGYQESEAKLNQEAVAQNFNTELSQYQAQHTGGLFGGGGFLGLGI